MKKEFLKYIVVSSLVFSGILMGNENIKEDKTVLTQEEKQETSTHAFPIAGNIAGSNLEEQRDKYLLNRNIILGFTKEDSYIGWAVSTIETSTKSMDFGQQRIMAFERAFIDAKGKFVQAKQQQVSANVMREFFENDIKEEKVELKDGRIKAIGEKLLVLAEAKLDKMLLDLGVNPKDVENSDITKKRKLAMDSIEKETIVRATQNISGIRILATFEDTKGVGVLIVQKPEYSTLAREMVQKKLAAIPSNESPTLNVANQLNKKFQNKNGFIPQYGVRVMTDSVGNRILVSFGQWSPKVTKADSQMKINMSVQAAQEISYNQALSYMTMFMNTTLALENKNKIKASKEITELTDTNGNSSKPESSNVGSFVDRFIKENSNVNIEGVSIIRTWTTNHPDTGHLIVGTVLAWSPLTQQFARQAPKKDLTDSTTTNSKESTVTNKVYESVDFGDDDF